MLTEVNQIYKCNICGNMVEMTHQGAGTLVCCGQDMQLKQANTQDASQEKHVPVVEAISGGIKVKVGSAVHPMEEKHFIEWIEVIADGQVCRKYLKPGDNPEAEFKVEAQNLQVREYCNIHGLWQA